MTKMNLTKKAVAMITSLTVTVTTLLSFPITVFAKESSALDEYTKMLYEIGMGGEPISNDNEWVDVVIDGKFWGSVKWYDTWEDAFQETRFSSAGTSRAEYKKYWLFGWRTQNCLIKFVDVCEIDGKYTPIYYNDYDCKFHADNRYM